MSLFELRRVGIFMLCLAIAAWSGLAYLSAPAIQPANADASVFSAVRAQTHVVALTIAPRPVGSAGHASARAYIIAELTRLGLTPKIQQTVSAFRFPGSEGFGVAKVQNVIARIQGSQSQSAILLNAHYDSGNTGPGAGDCGACVAALLETARALKAGPPPHHDVILVFSDGEEVGDHGAHAFATQHPWMKDVALALNYEAMGTAGPGSLYVTSDNNAALVKALALAMPNGFGNSVITELFNAIPDMRNACDLQDYLNTGVAGLGFVLHGQTQNYHTRLDDADHLSGRSLQSFGESALGMVRVYDQIGPKDLRAASDATFFSLHPFGTIYFPTTLALPLSVLGLIITVIVLAIGQQRKRFNLRSLLFASLGLVVTPIFVTAATAALWAGLRAGNPNLQVFLIGGFATPWHIAGLSVFAVGITLWLVGHLHRWGGADALLGGAILMLGTFGLLLAIFMPGMAYVATLPALFALPALIGVVLDKDGILFDVSVIIPAMAITSLVALLVAPSGMMIAFVTRLEAMTGFPLVALPTALTSFAASFIAALFSRYLPTANTISATRLTGAMLLISLVTLGVGAARSGFNAQQPRPESVRYELNADTRTAKWTTNDPKLGTWSGQFFPPSSQPAPDGSVRPGGPPTFSAPAPYYDFASPVVTLTKPRAIADAQKVSLEITSPRRAPLIEVRIDTNAAISVASIGGQELDLTGYKPATDGKLIFFASALAAEGFIVELTTTKSAKIHIKLADMSDGLPPPIRTRPLDTMPTPGATLDGIVIHKEFDL